MLEIFISFFLKLQAKKPIIAMSILVFSSIFLLISFGQIFTRWDLLQQIAMADRYLNGSNFYPYPGIEGFADGGVSGYFPGLAMIAIIFGIFFDGDSLIYFFSFLSLFVTLWFIYLLTIITKKISNVNNTTSLFLLYIACTCLFFEDYLFYSAEFKPDTIALAIGLASIIYSGLLEKKPNQIIKLIFMGMICGSAIIFKQQYIAFIFSLIIYSLINLSRSSIIFSVSAFLSSVLILYFLSYFDNIWFWTINVYKDDGFMGVKSFLQINQILIKNFLLFTLIFYYFYGKQPILKFLVYKNLLIKIFNILKTSPIYLVLMSTSSAAILSGIKMGGNSGNVGLGFLLMLPIFFSWLKKIDLKLITIMCFTSLMILMPSGLNTFNRYFLYQELSKEIEMSLENNLNVKNFKVLVGSDLYGVSRKFFKNNQIADYWTASTVANETILKEVVENYVFDLLIIETHSKEKFIASKSKIKYEVIFQNEIGFVARLKE